jgi:hypothetical protein
VVPIPKLSMKMKNRIFEFSPKISNPIHMNSIPFFNACLNWKEGDNFMRCSHKRTLYCFKNSQRTRKSCLRQYLGCIKIKLLASKVDSTLSRFQKIAHELIHLKIKSFTKFAIIRSLLLFAENWIALESYRILCKYEVALKSSCLFGLDLLGLYLKSFVIIM